MKTKNYYGDILVTEKRRIRLDIDLTGTPTKSAILKALKAGNYNDILDEEHIEYLVVHTEFPSEE